MKIEINQIQTILQLLLLKIAENRGKHLEINSDYYWNIIDSEIYNPYKEPKDLTLGQLTDDWEELKQLLTNSRDPIPYDFQRIANIVKAIGIENSTTF